MKHPSPPRAALLLLLAAAPLTAQESRPLDHAAAERWAEIRSERISPDGRFVAWIEDTPADARRLLVRQLASGRTLEITGARSPHFTRDSRHLWTVVSAESRALSRPAADPGSDGMPPAASPTGLARPHPDTLVVVDLERDLAGGPKKAVDLLRVPGAQDVTAPDGVGGWLAYTLPRSSRGTLPGLTSTLVLHRLEDDHRDRISHVQDFAFSADGRRLWYLRLGRAGGLWSTRPGHGGGSRRLEIDAPGRHLTVAPAGDRAAVLLREGEEGWSLWVAAETGPARRLAGPGPGGLGEGWRVSDHMIVRFAPHGRRIFFGAERRDELSPHERDPGADAVVVDVWSWTDADLQPAQLMEARRSRERAWLAAVPTAGGPVVHLEDPDLPEVRLPPLGGRVAMGLTDLPYRRRSSWETPRKDVVLVDLETGERTPALVGVREPVELSPAGRWITWWEGEAGAWWGLDTETGRTVHLSGRIPHPVHDELNDRPGPPAPYGLGGWTDGDARLLVYDRYDVWAVEPTTGRSLNLTDGLGREEALRLRVPDRAAGPATVPWDRELLLEAFAEADRRGGFYAVVPGEGRAPRRLVLDRHRYGVPLRAADAARLLFTREAFHVFPDLWIADPGPELTMRQVSDANPQQAGYRWGEARLVSWASPDGEPMSGLLYTPDGFDPALRYPLLVTVYERGSDDLHAYHPPAAGSASLNRSFYVSRGFLVFVPDIPYRVGRPGRSAADAVLSGVEALLEQGFVDPHRMAVEGHSWGGYQVAYLVTRTNLFAAAVAGAPVANMTSAYGGIRWGTGVSRMVQYEEGQSRIGQSLWEAPDLYVRNSPLFAADRVSTPLLMMHNDRDTAVPWEQGIEMFLALRRLEKPAWLLNYNGEEHALRRKVNRRDWAVRMQQFLEHYLLEAPPPVWMVEGVPAARKGETLGLDLVQEGGPVLAVDGVRPPGD